MDSRNEYLNTFSFSTLLNNPVVMVTPLLEIPGIRAMPCAIPISNESKLVSSLPFFLRSETKSKGPVISSKARPTARMLLKKDSKMSWKTRPMTAVGTLPTAMYRASLPSSVLRSNRTKALKISAMSLQNVNKTTHRVPTCNVTGKRRGSSPKPSHSCTITKCPELDIGSHSVMP